MSWGQVSIWGDLRDFEEEDCATLEKWWERILTELQPNPATKSMSKIDSVIASFSIRDAFLHYQIEYGPEKMLVWDAKVKKVVEMFRRPETEAQETDT